MKTWLAAPFVLTLMLSVSPAVTAERACRPSLSNFYHCPDSTASSTKPTVARSSRACHPSVSNFWTCPDNSRPGKTASSRPCRPSLSNGYSCPGTASASSRADRGTAASEKGEAKTASTERACRPSLSNGYKCPGNPSPRAKPSDAAQYATERQARAHCPGDTVVWANTHSNIYHFRGTLNYGNTLAGAYMCEQDSLSEGMRAAKNETHP
jgi:hypothetical protein